MENKDRRQRIKVEKRKRRVEGRWKTQKKFEGRGDWTGEREKRTG